ncbi:MAG: lipoate--protein ligase family protein [Abitibacteriaceae bacterium]|nr:lipoate--protein ligase family protein [Abditibacteriaceae bacterium]
MQFLDLTLASPYHDRACDEALLEMCEVGYEQEILRFWEPQEYFVVLGYTNKIREDVNLSACQTRHIPILRRTSGGGTVLQGRGCLNYSLILKIESTSSLTGISETNAFIMQRHRQALDELLGQPVSIQGITDLTLKNLKFSGNAQRRRRRFLLFHGTFLLDFDLDLVEQLLLLPARQPEYRAERTHHDFLTNLHIPAATIKDSLKKSWAAAELLPAVPFQSIEALVTEKYRMDNWTFKF